MGGADEIEDGIGFSGLVDLQAHRAKKDIYKASCSCLNCGQGFEVAIPKGTTVRRHNPACPNCGCTIRETAEEFEGREGR